MTATALALLAQDALYLALRLAAPCVLAAALAGLLVGLFQAATQAQDASLGFVAKLTLVAVALFLTRSFMTDELMRFSSELSRHVAIVAR
jgi:flagellar biosynthetic protein FliQ